MKKIAVVLCGCGHRDGSEIQEAVSTLLSIGKSGAEYKCFSLDIDQVDLVNHLNGESYSGKRNLLMEAARISRGKIEDIKNLKIEDFDAVIFPGGFGVAKNLFTYAFDGRAAKINEEVKRVITGFHANKKYIGAICIAPMLISRAFYGTDVKPVLTLGTDMKAAADLEYFGGVHQNRIVTDICIDEKNRIVSAPAYMHGKATLAEVYTGIEKLVGHIVARG